MTALATIEIENMTVRERRTRFDRRSSPAGVAIPEIDRGKEIRENMTQEIGNVTVIRREIETEIAQKEIAIEATVINNSSSATRADVMRNGQTTGTTTIIAVSIKSRCLTQNRNRWESLNQ